jgi:hypothetical protein
MKTIVGKFEVGIDGSRGYFEHEIFGEEYGGGLWFDEEDNLIDYDGISSCLPTEVARAIEELGYKIDSSFYGGKHEA